MLQPFRPFAIKAINLIEKYLSKAGICPASLRPPMSVEAVEARALAIAGLQDVPKTDDQSYREALNVICMCAQRAELTAIGGLVADGMVSKSLASRYKILDFRAKNPGVARERVRAPIFIVGLPRTGTTFLHNILAQDTSLRAPLHYEAVDPVPAAAERSCGARKAKAKKDLDAFLRLAPGFRAFHEISADAAEECVVFFQQTMLSQSYASCLCVPKYAAWLLGQNLHPVMKHHEQVLQHYQFTARVNGSTSDAKAENAGRGGSGQRRWLLKTPQYILMLREIFKVYPDARIIWTHRRPERVIKSYLGLTLKLAGMVTDQVDPKRFADEQLPFLNASIQFAMRDRRVLAMQGLEDRFLDVAFEDICQDPISVVRRVYKHIGATLSKKTADKMEAFRAENKRFRHGKPKFSLMGTFGVEEEKVAAMFRQYSKMYCK